MEIAERRRISRTKIERLACIQIEPDNGGIVLNVSGEGLCFHTIAPVEPNGALRFSLLEKNRRIDVCGELAWADEIQKIAGVRFTTLTTEAREQIQDWITQPAVPFEEQTTSTLGSTLLRALPGLRSGAALVSGGSFDRAVNALKRNLRKRLSGFSAGLATGLLASAFAIAIFFVSYAHRRQFGESLIHWGERLTGPGSTGSRSTGAGLAEEKPAKAVAVTRPATKPSTAQSKSDPAPPPGSGLALRNDSAPLLRNPHREQLPVARAKTLPSQLPASPNPQQSRVNSFTSNATDSHAPEKPTITPAQVSAAPETPAPPAANAASGMPLNPNATVVSNKSSSPAQLALSTPAHSQISVQNGDLLPQLYFDLGRFKEEAVAQNTRDQLAKLGLRSNVFHKGHLWNSYQVLVGPFGTEQEETRTHSDLVSHGYKPRPFERGSRNFTFGSRVSVNQTRLPIGDFNISWESYVTEAKVKLTQRGSLVAAADARWIKRPQKFTQNELVYRNTGSRPLLEVHLSGMDRALVFLNAQ